MRADVSVVVIEMDIGKALKKQGREEILRLEVNNVCIRVAKQHNLNRLVAVHYVGASRLL